MKQYAHSAGNRIPFRLSVFPGLAASALLTAACGMPCDETSFVSGIAPHENSAVRPLPKRVRSQLKTAREREPSRPAPDATERVHNFAATVVTELARRCPLANSADLEAFEACRKAMRTDSKLRASFSPQLIWGRYDVNQHQHLAQSDLTWLPQGNLAETHLPLFMFSDKRNVIYSPQDKLYRVEVGARFRHRLPMEQLPEKTLPADEKGNAYEGTNAMLLWVDPGRMTIRAVQFTNQSKLEW